MSLPWVPGGVCTLYTDVWWTPLALGDNDTSVNPLTHLLTPTPNPRMSMIKENFLSLKQPQLRKRMKKFHISLNFGPKKKKN
jgi:hypothetical protein